MTEYIYNYKIVCKHKTIDDQRKFEHLFFEAIDNFDLDNEEDYDNMGTFIVSTQSSGGI